MPAVGRLQSDQVGVRCGRFVVANQPDDLGSSAVVRKETSAFVGVAQQQVYALQPGSRFSGVPDARREAGREATQQHHSDTSDDRDSARLADIVQDSGLDDGPGCSRAVKVVGDRNEMVLVVR